MYHVYNLFLNRCGKNNRNPPCQEIRGLFPNKKQVLDGKLRILFFAYAHACIQVIQIRLGICGFKLIPGWMHRCSFLWQLFICFGHHTISLCFPSQSFSFSLDVWLVCHCNIYWVIFLLDRLTQREMNLQFDFKIFQEGTQQTYGSVVYNGAQNEIA